MAEIVLYIGSGMMIISYILIVIGMCISVKRLVEIGTVLFSISAIVAIVAGFLVSELGQKIYHVLSYSCRFYPIIWTKAVFPPFC